MWKTGDSHLSLDAGKTLVGFMPMFSYYPDTRLLLGMSNSLIWRADRLRPTLLTNSISYAFNNQKEFGTELEHFTQNGWQFYGRVNYQNGISTRYFGTGIQAETNVNIRYNQNALMINTDILKRIHEPLYLGLRYAFRNDNRITFEKAEKIMIPQEFGGITSGIGLLARFDSRNEIIFPSKGWFIDVNLMRYGSKVGSAYSYNEILTDFRSYRKLNGIFSGSVLGIQFIYQSTYGGDIPFYNLPYIGYDRIIRGLWRNLYIDQQAIGIQTELRSHFTNIDTRHGYVLFAGAGKCFACFFPYFEACLGRSGRDRSSLAISSKEKTTF